MSCDDGDILFQDNIFQTEELKSCDLVNPNNFYLFKIEGDKALILQLGVNSNTIFKNELTTTNSPRQLTIQNDIKLIERTYNRNLATGDICNTLPPTDLLSVREWTSQSGTIEVRTTAIKQVNSNNNETRLSKYRHTINIRNLTINRDGQLITYDNFEVGFYEQYAEAFPSLNSNTISRCGDTNRYILNTTRHIFEINLPDIAFENIDTPANTPRIYLINSDNKFLYRIYPETFLQSQICELTPQAASEIWEAENGVANTSGIIEISTTSAPDPNTPTIINFTHQVKLKKLKMIRNKPNDGIDFQLGDEIILGEYKTNQ